ncbi:MAG: MobF family relaxase, partial [Candidatus Puniceispirillales bacterium WSBS_2018_MAG_OTU23]
MVAALTPITSSSKTVDYFTKDGYYAKDDLEHKKESYWHGRGASEGLGFKGMVEPADFAAVMEGHLEKHDISLGRIRDGEREHRPGFDLTFTAPKSVSIEGLVFGKNPVIKAHQEAVKATLDFVEENFIETRTYDPSTKKSNRTPTGKMVAANFQHDTSRNLDPHLHTHCIIANMTINEKGEWRSIESTALNRHKKLIGSYYHNELARGLLEQGYELEGRMIGKLPGFEIAGYDRKEIDEFSTRRQEMLEYLSERGLPLTAKTAQIAVLATRAEKIEIPRHELQQQWAEKVAELEIEPQSWQSRKQNRDDYTIENDHANDNNRNIYDAITFALNDIETRHSVFPASELQSHVLGQLAGRITFDDLNKTINQMQADGHLIKAQRRGHDLAYVTETTLNTERSIIAHMNNGKDQVEPIRADFEATNADLTPDQNQAIEMVLTSPDKVIGIQGYAGTGKTTMLKTLANEAHDMKVIGLAPSTTATHVLMREAQIPANTLQHFLTKFGNIDQMDAPTLKEHQDNLSKTVLVVDESSMISTKQMNRLFNITEKLDIEHVVLVGDSKQLRSIEAGQPFRQLQEHGMSISLMDTIMRQKDPSLKLAVEAVLDGNITRSLEHLEPNLIESFNLGKDAANIWLELDKDTRENTLILAPTHDLRDDINTTIRDSLKMENTLSGPEMEQERLINRHMTPYQKSEAHNYNEGDVLVFHNDALNYRIEKDDHYTVMAAGRDSHIQVENNLGEARQIKTNSTVRYNYNVYEPMEINLQAGDAIRFTRNNKEHDIVNGGTAEITEITPSKLHLTDDDGKQMSFRHDDKVLQHLDHDYSRTVHAAQGMTADHVIAVLDSGHGQLTDQQSF